MAGILYAIAALFIALWVIGFLFAHVVAPLIHVLLVVGLVMLAVNYFTKAGHRRAI